MLRSGGPRIDHHEYKALRRTARTPHGRFTYVDEGEGPALLMLPGLFVSAFLWRKVIDGMRGERRCVAFNLPHHSGGEVPAEQPLHLQANAEMLEGFCDAVGLDRFDLLANDTGGAIAQAFAVRNPDRVRTLLVTNCELKDWMPSHDEFAQLVARTAAAGELAAALKAAYDDLDAARATALGETYERPELLSDDDLRGMMEPHQATVGAARHLERFMNELAPEQLRELEPALRELTIPTKLVWGTGDSIFPLHLAEWFRDEVPCCDQRIELIEGGKLFWPFERGDELLPHLRAHWREAARA